MSYYPVSNVSATGTLAALNDEVMIPLVGQSGSGFQLQAGTLIGTLVAEFSFDGGVTYNAANLISKTSNLSSELVFTAANTAEVRAIAMQGGATNARVRVAAFTSGSAVLQLSGTSGIDATDLNNISSAAGILGALNAEVVVALAGQGGIGFQLQAGTLIGTLVAELSFDGGVTFNPTLLFDGSSFSSSLSFTAANTAQARSLVIQGGATHARVRVSAFTSGTANLALQATQGITTTNISAPTDGYKRTYAASIRGLVAAALATDIFTITGAAGKVVRITRIIVGATRTANATSDLLIIKRSTANTLGTSTVPTAVPYDSMSEAAAAVVRAYTANPTLGVAVGQVMALKQFIQSGGGNSPMPPIDIEFGKKFGSSIILRSASEVLALNLNGVTLAGNNFDITIEWTEESLN